MSAEPLKMSYSDATVLGLTDVPAYYDFKTDTVRPVTPEVFESFHAKTIQVSMTLQVVLRALHELQNAPNNLKLGRALALIQELGEGQVVRTGADNGQD